MMTMGITRLPGLEAAACSMPFDQFGRYHMLREAVDACRKALGRERLHILDVGGFYETHGSPSLPIMTFLPDDDVSVLDVVACDLPGYVQGDGTSLHFPDGSFDFVVSLDTLEHIPQVRRAAFWCELLRVARSGVILLAPFGTPEVEAAEALLFEYIKVELSAEHQQLKEHRDYGLPILEEWLQFLAGRGITARAFPTGQLRGWLGMMLVKHMLLRMDPGNVAQQLVDSYYNQHFFPTERHNPAYRHLIIAEKEAGLVAAVTAVLAPTIGDDQVDQGWTAALLPAMMAVFVRQIGALREHVEQQGADLRSRLDAPENAGDLRAARQEISQLARLLGDQQWLLARANEQTTALTHELSAAHTVVRVQAERHEATVRDLLERAHWLEAQNAELRRQIEAIQNGRVMKLLRRLP